MQDSPLRVVLADDDRDIRRILKTMLVHDGIDVVAQAQDGYEAIALAQQVQPHVMLIDLMMPGMNGAEAVRVISRRWPEVVLVGLTAGGAEARQNLLEAGAASVFDKTQICDLLDWMLEQRPRLADDVEALADQV